MMKKALSEELLKTAEKFVLPNGEQVFFAPEEHLYSVQGFIVPSVTNLVDIIYNNTYNGVNPELLKKTAEYGSNVHKELQEWIEIRKQNPEAQVISPYVEVENYFTFIEPIYKIDPILTEQVIVIYHPKTGEPVAAGRFDLLCYVDKNKTLADFKTTSTIHKKEVTLQLNLYVLGLKQSKYVESIEHIDMGVIHLNGDKSKFVPIMELSEDFLRSVCEKGE